MMQPNNSIEPAAPQPRRNLADKLRALAGTRVAMFLFSLVGALMVWLLVTMYFDQEGSKTIYNATVNYSYGSTAYTALDLDIVEYTEVSRVQVLVQGNGTIIGNMRAEDIMVYPNYSSVRGAGETTLSLEARIVNSDYTNQGIELTVESPTSITAVFDSVSEKVVPVTADTSQISIADGYILNRSVALPAEVTLRGPTSELDQISKVVAPVSSEDSLSDSTTLPAVLELRDADNTVIETDYTTLDSEVANVTMTVYQVRTLPLAIDFIGTPTGFDTSSLRYSLSTESLRVAGPARIVSSLTELSVFSFDLGQEFVFDRDYQRPIQLPDGVVSQDGVSSVTLTFDTTSMASTTLNISNIRRINVPSNLDIEVLSSMVDGVTLYGPADEIEELTADSVIAQIDCQSISVQAGQQTLPVTIQIPSSTHIFATGSYTVQCEITSN